jgi:subtilisin family serine protease
VLAVGSVDVNLERSSFSNYGADVTVYAPGRDILTTSLDGDYELMTGTSFAAPHVAAIAALNRVFNLPINTEDSIVYLYTPQEQPVCP